MSVSLSEFEGAVEADKKLRRACDALGLSSADCKRLEGYVGEICGATGRTAKRAKGTRQPSRWQQCISERRKGKPFDPQAMKKLAVEYKAGRCPSG